MQKCLPDLKCLFQVKGVKPDWTNYKNQNLDLNLETDMEQAKATLKKESVENYKASSFQFSEIIR